MAVFSLLQCFADADDREQSCPPGGARLGRYLFVRLAVILPTLGMTDDYCLSSGVSQHLGTDVAGERARDLRATVLAAELQDRASDFNGTRDQCRRRTYEYVAPGRLRDQRRRQQGDL